MRTKPCGKDWKFLLEKYVLGKHPTFEPEVRRTIKKYSGALAVDVGANYGVHTRLLSKRFKKVVAIEPNPKALEVLRSKVPRNVTVLNVALSNQEGSTMFYTDPHPTSGSSAQTILPTFNYNPSPPRKGWPSSASHTFHGEHGFVVNTTTYDKLLRGENADLVLIDVEGAEFLVLEGMKDSIATGQVKSILLELHDISKRGDLEKKLSNYAQTWVDPDHLLAQAKTT